MLHAPLFFLNAQIIIAVKKTGKQAVEDASPGTSLPVTKGENIDYQVTDVIV